MAKIEPSCAANLIAGFKATGISPLNPNTVLKKIPGATLSPSAAQIQAQVSGALLSHLQEQRLGDENAPKRGRKRRIQVSPGKSIGTGDLPRDAAGPEDDGSPEEDDPQALDDDLNESSAEIAIEPKEGKFCIFVRTRHFSYRYT